MKKDIESALIAAFARELGKEGAADPSSHAKMAAAISDVALVIVNALQQDAEVSSAIPTAGSPSSQITTAPGKIL